MCPLYDDFAGGFHVDLVICSPHPPQSSAIMRTRTRPCRLLSDVVERSDAGSFRSVSFTNVVNTPIALPSLAIGPRLSMTSGTSLNGRDLSVTATPADGRWNVVSQRRRRLPAGC
jgi:hypothetical protein